MTLFANPLHEEFGTWPLGFIRYGGLDFGEVRAVGRVVGTGDDGAYHDAWMAAGDRLAAEAEAAQARGRLASARALFLKATCAYGTSYHPLFGAPADPRLLAAFRRAMDAFARAQALADPPLAPLRIPFEGTSLPAWLIPAAGRAAGVRPLLIVNNGYDTTLAHSYFGSAAAAAARGYHCLVFDGPGQGEMLFEHGMPLRPDWETVVRAVVDFAVALPGVDPRRIALSGWSLGGHLAPRAASGEKRLAACIADPGLWSIAEGFRSAAIRLGAAPEAVADLGAIDQALLDRMAAMLRADPKLAWGVLRRGLWVHGVSDLRGYLRAVEAFTLAGRIERIACPTLVTRAENDPLAAHAHAMFDALRCPKTLLRFTAAEGADGHCEMGNRSLLNDRVLDWLDEVLA